mgnify:CR=1 FL=1
MLKENIKNYDLDELTAAYAVIDVLKEKSKNTLQLM